MTREVTDNGVILVDGSKPIPTYVHTLRIYPRENISKLEFVSLVRDIDSRLKGDGAPIFLPENQAVQIDNVKSFVDDRGVRWRKKGAYLVSGIPFQSCSIPRIHN